MEKIGGKKDFVNGEIARLDNIIKSGTISGNKIDDFTIKINILKNFHEDGSIPTHQEL
jgi:hypothetical protein